MHLALGDVVRDRTDMALGTVVGVATQAGVSSLSRVAVHVPGGSVRLSDPYDLEIVARHARPATARHGLAALVVLAVAALAAVLGCLYARTAGADWLLMFLAGLGAFAAVTATYHLGVRLTGPRRFRV
ncbi:hypothetical protein ACIBLA_30040 [Streptomyces sp. NPDC050433]|uniref:hypothetical protein n=1 Tax=Streptomyces sp. NPDC050433 TaxID=3365615 RepID=UPI0037B056C0